MYTRIKNLYLESGYVNFKEIKNISVPWVFIIGGRGTGKTYGALSEMLDTNDTFMFMRRTQSQCDMINKPEFSPFKSVCDDREGVNIGTVSVSKYNAAFYHMINDGDKLVPTGKPIGFTCALSTISNMRGFDASEVKTIIYDEFIPERHERPLRNEGDALFNAYETINRNREIKGQEPVKLIAMTNANDLSCPIFAALDLIDTVDYMARKHKECFIDINRGIAIVLLQDSPISAAKRGTALYKLTRGSKFESMSLNNEFSGEDYSNVCSKPIAEYNPIVVYDDICIYEHKSNNTFYVARHISGNPPRYSSSELDTKNFKNTWGYIYIHIINGDVFFADYYCKLKLTKIF